jgi:hypothetical protein
MLPSIDNPIWRKLITKEIDYKFSNYIIQLHIFHLRNRYAMKQIDLQEAINELYQLCNKYTLLVKKDFQKLLNT